MSYALTPRATLAITTAFALALASLAAPAYAGDKKDKFFKDDFKKEDFKKDDFKKDKWTFKKDKWDDKKDTKKDKWDDKKDFKKG